MDIRSIINLIESIQGVDPSLEIFVKLAQKHDNVESFIQATDGQDVLYRGHYDDDVPNNAFMTDYVGHAGEYAGDGGRVDAYAYDPSDVLFFNNARFDEFRNAMRGLTPQQLGAAYKAALAGNRHAGEFSRSLTQVRKIIRSNTPYEDICGTPGMNDPLVPLLQAYAREKGKNIIAFLGSDYADYGGQNEFVVGDVSKLVDLRKLYASVRG